MNTSIARSPRDAIAKVIYSGVSDTVTKLIQRKVNPEIKLIVNKILSI
jgi:hypothetical protein